MADFFVVVPGSLGDPVHARVGPQLFPECPADPVLLCGFLRWLAESSIKGRMAADVGHLKLPT